MRIRDDMMKNVLENICQKFHEEIAIKPYLSLLMIICLYLLFCCLYYLIFDTGENFFSIFINPVFIFGTPYLILDYLRYKELKKTYKNYTLEEFIYTYKNAPDLAYAKPSGFKHFQSLDGKLYYDKETILKFKPLAKNILSLNRYYTDTEDLENKEIASEEFIKQKYQDNFKFDYFLPTQSASFYYILLLGIYIQLSLWEYIEIDD